MGFCIKHTIILAILLLPLFRPVYTHALGPSPRQESTYIQFALSHPNQVYPDYWDVHGFRFNLIHGRNRNVYGLDTGTYNVALKQAKGLQIGLVGNETLELRGAQVSGFFENFVKDAKGAQVAIGLVGMNSAKQLNGFQYANLRNIVHTEMRGVQMAIGDNDAGNMKGLQVGLLLNNFMRLEPELIDESNQGTRGDVTGVQIAGACNYAYHIYGIQFGLINYCVNMSGVQIGLANVILEGPLTFCPIFNTGYPLFSFIWGEEAEEEDQP